MADKVDKSNKIMRCSKGLFMPMTSLDQVWICVMADSLQFRGSQSFQAVSLKNKGDRGPRPPLLVFETCKCSMYTRAAERLKKLIELITGFVIN